MRRAGWLRVRAASYFVDAKKAPPRERPLLTLRHVDLFDGSSLASDGDDARVDFCRTRPESWFRREFERDALAVGRYKAAAGALQLCCCCIVWGWLQL